MTKTQDNILDELFEVKIGDNQTGYLWAKLSPKSKKRLKSLLKQAELRAKIEALTDFAQAHFMKTRQHGYDEENYQLVRYEVGILENELAELKKLNLGDK